MKGLASKENVKQFPLPRGLGNYLILDKSSVTLFSNFIRHHLITHAKTTNLTFLGLAFHKSE